MPSGRARPMDLRAAGTVDLTFVVKPKTQVQKVAIDIAPSEGDKITEEELLFKLNVLSPGTAITEQTLRNNADEILDYLRERGFYKSEVTYEVHRMQNQNEVGVTFKVTPNAQTTVSNFVINIQGYNKPIPEDSLKLKKGGNYSRERLLADVAKVRDILKKDNYLAPELDEREFLRPRQLKRDLPAPLEAICLKAMALKPEDRYTAPKALLVISPVRPSLRSKDALAKGQRARPIFLACASSLSTLVGAVL